MQNPEEQLAARREQSAKMDKPTVPAVVYYCAECYAEMTLRSQDPVRCTTCGWRVLYKKRTDRCMVFDAR